MSGNCKAREIDFIVLDTDPEMKVVEDDIRADLAKIGISVNTKFLSRSDYLDFERNGTYNMLFTRTWVSAKIRNRRVWIALLYGVCVCALSECPPANQPFDTLLTRTCFYRELLTTLTATSLPGLFPVTWSTLPSRDWSHL